MLVELLLTLYDIIPQEVYTLVYNCNDFSNSDCTSLFTAPSLLQQISSLRSAESKEDSSIQLSTKEKKPARPGLIEVISSTESGQPEPKQPRHHLTVCPEGNNSGRSLKLNVELPGVQSVSQCQLSISQVSLPHA